MSRTRKKWLLGGVAMAVLCAGVVPALLLVTQSAWYVSNAYEPRYVAGKYFGFSMAGGVPTYSKGEDAEGHIWLLARKRHSWFPGPEGIGYGENRRGDVLYRITLTVVVYPGFPGSEHFLPGDLKDIEVAHSAPWPRQRS